MSTSSTPPTPPNGNDGPPPPTVPASGSRPASPPATGSKPVEKDSKRGKADETKPHHGLTDKGRVETTRAGAWWSALIAAAVLGILLLIFIAQNGDAVTIKFLGFSGSISLAVGFLASAAVGALVVAIPGIARIIQLRRALRKNAKES